MEGYGQNINGSELYFNYDPSKSYTAGEKFVWQSPSGDWRTYLVRPNQTLLPGQTPFTNAEKVQRIDGRRIVTVNSNIQSGIASALNPTFDIKKSNKRIMYGLTNATGLRIVSEDNIGNKTLLATLTSSAVIWDVVYIPSIDEFWVLNLNNIERYSASSNTFIANIALGGTITATAMYQLIVDETRGVVYVMYLQTNVRLIRVQISSLSIIGSFINTGTPATRQGVLNEQTGFLYTSSTGTGARIIDVGNWSSVTIFNIPSSGSVNIPFILPQNRICYLLNSLAPKIYDISAPSSPVLITSLLNSVRGIYGVYSEITNNIFIFNRGGTNNNYQNRITVYDYFDNRIIEETNPFIEQNGSIPFPTNELHSNIIYDEVNRCIWYAFSQNIAGVNGIIKTNL